MAKQNAAPVTLNEALAKANRIALARFGGRVAVGTGDGSWYRATLWRGPRAEKNQGAASAIAAVVSLTDWMTERTLDLEGNIVEGQPTSAPTGGAP